MNSAASQRVLNAGTSLRRAKASASLVLTFLLMMIGNTQLHAAEASSVVSPPRLPGVELAQTFSEITGVAISPLLGLSAVSAWKYYHTPEAKRAALPWHCSPYVWGTGFALLALCFLKDLVGTAAPPLVKKPLDAVELFENKASALVASTAFVPLLIANFGESLSAQGDGTAWTTMAAGSGLAMTAMTVPSILITVGLTLFAMLWFLVVWLAFHTINVMIAISPFGLVDGLLKLFKTGLIFAVAVSSFISPWLGLAVSVIIGVIAILVAPWAFRLTLFGTWLALDCLRFRSVQHRAGVGCKEVRCFTAQTVEGVPVRTLGVLKQGADGVTVFAYRPRFIQSERKIVLPPDRIAMVKGILWPSVVLDQPDGKSATLLNLLPRYRTLEDQIVTELSFASPARHGAVVRSFKAFWKWCKETATQGKSGVLRLKAHVQDAVAGRTVVP